MSPVLPIPFSVFSYRKFHLTCFIIFAVITRGILDFARNNNPLSLVVRPWHGISPVMLEEFSVFRSYYPVSWYIICAGGSCILNLSGRFPCFYMASLRAHFHNIMAQADADVSSK